MNQPPGFAWVERDGNEPVPVTGNCALGRAVGNDIVLMDDRVSRRHATIHAQGDQEFLLVDLGSRNGTYLNGRRVNQPTRLKEGDQLQVGPFTLKFHQPAAPSAMATSSHHSAQTLVELQSVPCWLLLCDIAGSSKLAQEKTAEELAMLVGGWFARCKEVIEDNGGVINKYLGDGLLAYWRAENNVLPYVSQALRDFAQLQKQGEPAFRVVLHWGQITIGGTPSSGEDSLVGPQVNIIFRLERLSSELRASRIASAQAVEKLAGLISATSAGRHALPGFEGTHEVYAFEVAG